MRRQPILLDALTFPWRGNAKWLLFWLIILSCASYLSAFAWLMGLMASLIIFAYFCATYCHLVELSTSEDEIAVSPPDIANPVGDLLIPVFRVVVVFLIGFSPQIALLFFGSGEMSVTAGYLTLIPAFLYIPMAILSWIVLNNIIGISPHVVFPAIFTIGLPYLWIVLMIFLIYAIGAMLESDATFPSVGQFLVEKISGPYLMMSNARLVGIIFRDNNEKLNWF